MDGINNFNVKEESDAVLLNATAGINSRQDGTARHDDNFQDSSCVDPKAIPSPLKYVPSAFTEHGESLESEKESAVEEFSIEISCNSLHLRVGRGSGGLLYGCQQCPHVPPFSTAIDLVCHNFQLHQTSWSYFCKICHDTLHGIHELAQHVRHHEMNHVKVFDSQRFKTEDEAGDDSDWGGGWATRQFKRENGIGKRRSKRKSRPVYFKEESDDSMCGDIGGCDALEPDISFEDDKEVLDKIKVDAADSDAANFLCNFCGKDFDSKKYLNRHLKKHKQPFVCPRCSLACDRFCDLRKHFRVDHGAKILKCPYCKQISDKSHVIIGHIKEYHENRKESQHFERNICETFLECDACKKIFVTKPALRAHTKKHVREPVKPICSKCGQQFKSNLTLKNHMVTHLDQKQFLCSYCGKEFSHRSSLKNHIMNHTNDKRFKCAHCSECFVTNAHLRQHERVHSGERPYQCEECGKSFSQSGSIRRHMLIHSGERPFTCAQCSKSFNQASTLSNHMRTHTGDRKPLQTSATGKYQCNLCDRSFSSAGYLNMHSRSHAEEATLACSLCNKQFPTAAHLKIHNRIHKAERPFKCSYCEKSFSKSSSLYAHLKLHSGDKPHKCAYCSKSFVAQAHLQIHTRTHTGEKPFKCAQCERAFSAQSSLARHQLIHVVGKPYVCDYCAKEFTQFHSLADHINVHTGARPYKCSHCISCFANHSTLVRHVARHVSGKPHAIDGV